jgi:hypothetical protein
MCDDLFTIGKNKNVSLTEPIPDNQAVSNIISPLYGNYIKHFKISISTLF